MQFGIKVVCTRNIDHTITILSKLYMYITHMVDIGELDGIPFISLVDYQIITNKTKNLNHDGRYRYGGSVCVYIGVYWIWMHEVDMCMYIVCVCMKCIIYLCNPLTN